MHHVATPGSTAEELRAVPPDPDLPLADVVETLLHDLRSPMTGLHGFTSLLAERWTALDDHQRRDLLTHIMQETRRMSRMVEDVNAAMFGEPATLTPRLVAVDVAAVARELVGAAGRAAPEHQVRFLTDPTPAQAHGDRRSVAEVLGILLDNATRHTPARTLVTVRVVSHGETVRSVVTDRGPGIAAEVIERILVAAPSSAADATISGLQRARSLAHGMGGSLTLAAGAAGTTAAVTLRAACPI